MASFSQDLRCAWRAFCKNPGFSFVSVLTLALGIGATSAVFVLVHGVLLTPPPYHKPEELVLLTTAKAEDQSSRAGCTARQWTEWRREVRSFAAMAGYIWTFDYLVLPEGSEFFQGMEVTPDYFSLIGTRPLLGRTLVETDASSKGDTVIVLGYDFWQRRFRGDPGILGQTIKITRAERPLTIVGVMPPELRFLPAFSNADFPNYDINARIDYWIPVTAERAEGPEWNVAARLRTGVTLEQANLELAALTVRQAQGDRTLEGITARAQRLETELNRDGRRLLMPLLGAVTLVLLIACGNIAGLLLVRGLQRQHEYIVRGALGAQRSRIFRQALTESLLLSAVGGTLGLALALGIVSALKTIGKGAIPRLDAVTIGWPVLACCFCSAVAAALVAGWLPALRASQVNLAQGIKGLGPTGSATRAERRLFRGIAILQAALTLALLVGTGLLIRTVEKLTKLRPGFDTDNILTMNVTVPNWDGKQWYQFHVRALERLASIPGVKSAAFGWGLPLTGDKWITRVIIEDQPDTGKWADALLVAKRSVTPAYFDTLGIAIVEGRGFRSSDNLENWKTWRELAPGETPYVCLINQAMAERYFPHANAIGKMVRVGPWDKRPCQIVGIVANTRTEALTQAAGPEIYVPFLQCPVFTKHLILRTASDAASLTGTIRGALRAIDPTVAIDHIKTFAQIRGESVAAQWFAMRLLLGFAATGWVLASVGIYSVLLLSVRSRRREIAIRVALGAPRRSIVGLILSEGLQLVALGCVLGIAVAAALARVLRTLLFEVGSADAGSWLGAAVLFALVTMAACWFPARHATDIQPSEALRQE